MYWPVTSARRLHLSPSGLHKRPPGHQEDAIAAKALADAAGPPTAGIVGGSETSDSKHGFHLGFGKKKSSGAEAGDESEPGPSSSTSQSFAQNGQDEEDEEEELVDVARSKNGAYWASLSRHTIAVWSTRPSQVIAAVVRTRKSVEEYGGNKAVHWQMNGLGLVVEVSGRLRKLLKYMC